ncbi:MAG: hypothetical protein UT33_C0005G0149 [Candidatus Peregrinibacteria bacterium GW2011_GWC2_39_14]|nr:MAG: hypothetical protein US92_C0001G0150 [Candidatus Peregrinibacteria bacterium GW2011_GWA2_38_36]KKR07205.1 MAG: hypothetical protein UT33_C0005G0149 [Candidatus Peregrinibacteria bacterium GW2011_GWC2_39_14]
MRYPNLDTLKDLDAPIIQKKLRRLEAEARMRRHPGRELRIAIERHRRALLEVTRGDQNLELRQLHAERAERHGSHDHAPVNPEHGRRIGACLLRDEETFVFTIHHPDPTLPQTVKVTGIGIWKHTDVHDGEFDDREAAIEACRNFFKFHKDAEGRRIDMTKVIFDKTREV